MLRHFVHRDRKSRYFYGLALLGLAALAAAGALTAVGFWGSTRASASVSNPSQTAAQALNLPAPQGQCAISQHSIRTRMRDGTILEADVYQPVTSQKVPVLLMRTQYDKASSEWNPLGFARPEYYAEHCYIVVVQDVRGQYKSRGNFEEFANEQKDGYDTVQAVAQLPGSDGRVGMWGVSYVGATQWLAAETAPPALKAIVPVNTASDYYNNWSYQDGAWSLAFEENWPMNTIVQSRAEHEGRWGLATQIENDDQPAQLAKEYQFLPLDRFPAFHPNDPTVAKYFYDWIRNSTDDQYWKRWNPNTHYPDINVPVLNVDGWYDVFLDGALQNFTGMRTEGGSAFARANQQIVIGPYTHTNWSGIQPWGPAGAPAASDRIDLSSPTNMNYGPTANLPINQLMLNFYDHYLKGINNGVQDEPAVRYFEMGANQWKSATAWPIPGTQWEKYYLTSSGHANSARGDGQLTPSAPSNASRPDRYVYNPRNPVPSMGGHSCCDPAVDPEGPADQSAIEQRPDVLVYTTPALQKSMEVTGPISVTLYAASSARDTDFTAKLVDVYPDGRAINLNDGVVVARFRKSVTQPSLITPGKIYKYTINVWPTSNLFMAGHSIRLEISSSNFPMYARNTNTGDRFGTDTYGQLKVAQQAIYHSGQYPSEVTLPVIPATSQSAASTR